MQTYNIQIDEAQRARIVAALEMLDALQPPEANREDEDYLSDFGVVQLRPMLEKLPADELESPRSTHGLCL